MEDEETGIDLGDDELWEDDDIEEIPLFEEEFLEQELESETESAVPENDQPPDKQDTGQARKDEAGQSSGVEAPEEDEKTPQDPREKKAAAAPDTGPEGLEETEASAEPEKGDSQGQPQEKAQAQTVEDEGGLRAFIPWIVTGLSAGLCVAAIFTIWLIASSADTKTANKLQPSAEIPEETVQPPVRKAPPKTATRPARGIAQAIDLAPFLIPAQRAGDLVFFKLRVELIAPDATTKQEILKREAWVRDIIYQELKGINISRGIKGDILTRYRRPLLERLNRELAPLHLEDIRLMGFLLR
jgi:flagellar basal body-associated protein FliL